MDAIQNEQKPLLHVSVPANLRMMTISLQEVSISDVTCSMISLENMLPISIHCTEKVFHLEIVFMKTVSVKTVKQQLGLLHSCCGVWSVKCEVEQLSRVICERICLYKALDFTVN